MKKGTKKYVIIKIKYEFIILLWLNYWHNEQFIIYFTDQTKYLLQNIIYSMINITAFYRCFSSIHFKNEFVKKKIIPYFYKKNNIFSQ